MIKLTLRDYLSIPFIYISITIMQFAYFLSTEWGKDAIEDVFAKNLFNIELSEKETRG